MKTVLSALVRQKGHARGAMGLAAKLQANNETFRARIAELEAALAPFAEIPNSDWGDEEWIEYQVKAGDLRRACDAMRNSANPIAKTDIP